MKNKFEFNYLAELDTVEMQMLECLLDDLIVDVQLILQIIQKKS